MGDSYVGSIIFALKIIFEMQHFILFQDCGDSSHPIVGHPTIWYLKTGLELTQALINNESYSPQLLFISSKSRAFSLLEIFRNMVS